MNEIEKKAGERARELVATWAEDFDISSEEQKYTGLEIRITAALLDFRREGRKEMKEEAAHLAECIYGSKLSDELDQQAKAIAQAIRRMEE